MSSWVCSWPSATVLTAPGRIIDSIISVSQLDRLLRSRSIDPSPGNSAPKQESALPHLRPRLSCPFAVTAPRQHHRRYRAVPHRICRSHFLFAHPSRPPSLEVFPFLHLLCRRRAFLARPVH